MPPGMPVARRRLGLAPGIVNGAGRWHISPPHRPPEMAYDEMVNEQQTTLSTDDHSLGWALCFEVSLGLIALLCGYATDVWPAEKLAWPPSISTVILGLLTALPPLFLMLGVRRLPLRVVRDLTRIVDQKVGPMFKGLRVGELAMLSLAAGWGEELLFRGLIQAEIASSGGIVVGILVASVVFALVHSNEFRFSH